MLLPVWQALGRSQDGEQEFSGLDCPSDAMWKQAPVPGSTLRPSPGLMCHTGLYLVPTHLCALMSREICRQVYLHQVFGLSFVMICARDQLSAPMLLNIGGREQPEVLGTGYWLSSVWNIQTRCLWILC